MHFADDRVIRPEGFKTGRGMNFRITCIPGIIRMVAIINILIVLSETK